jgi:hypothetical protein
MKFAIIKDNKVENVVLADEDFASLQGWVRIPEESNVGVNWGFDGNSFTEILYTENELNKLAKEMRLKRNELLKDSDWTQLGDSPLNADAKLAWALYRETLRMVPQQSEFPLNIIWPPLPTP